MSRNIPEVLLIADEGRGATGLSRLLRWLDEAGVQAVLVSGSSGLPGDLAGFDGLVVFGGCALREADGRSSWLSHERTLAATAIAEDLPTLGICLGAQVLAHAAGGQIDRDQGEPRCEMVEVRTTVDGAQDPVLSTLEPKAHLLAHCRDQITDLSHGGVLLASSPARRVQAFRIGRHVRGVQFHPEASSAEFLSWDTSGERLPEHGRDPDQFVAESQRWDSERRRSGRALARAFAEEVRHVAASSSLRAQGGYADPLTATGVASEVATALVRTVRTRQAAWRVPGVYGGVSRRGVLIWGEGVGAGDLDHPDKAPTSDVQYLIASNTKTFTAIAVMALRDEGRLSLDDTIDTHLPEVAHRGITIREMLAHVSGMQREPVGDVWEIEHESLIANFNQAERVLRPHYRWHYSNLVYAVLGELVARLDGRSWAESIAARILRPLEMKRTSVGLSGNAARGYRIPHYTDVPVEEPVADLKAMAACGGLASTAGDLARWQGFLADPVPEVLSPDTVEEMIQPQAIADLDEWTQAQGLGFSLRRVRGRIFAGHTGGLPGHSSGVFTSRETGTGGIALMNTSAENDPAGLAIELASYVIENDPELPPTWKPGSVVPEGLLDILGQWFSEGERYFFSVRDGCLEGISEGQVGKAPSTFTKCGKDTYRTVSGRETGELLTIDRGPNEGATTLHWATYLFTREP